MGQLGVVQLRGFFRGEDEALGREADGRRHDALKAELAVFALGIGQAGHRAGRGDGAVANDAGVGNDIAFGVLVHGFGGGQGRLFAVIDKRRPAVVHAQEQESAAAQVAGEGMDNGEGKAGGHSRIHRIAAFFQDFKAGVGGKVVNADHHAVARTDGLLAAPGQDVLLRGLGRGEDRRAGNYCGESGEKEAREFHAFTG